MPFKVRAGLFRSQINVKPISVVPPKVAKEINFMTSSNNQANVIRYKSEFIILFRLYLREYLACKSEHLFFAACSMNGALANYLNDVGGIAGEW